MARELGSAVDADSLEVGNSETFGSETFGAARQRDLG